MTFKEVTRKIEKQRPNLAYSTNYIQVEFIFTRSTRYGIRQKATWLYLN